MRVRTRATTPLVFDDNALYRAVFNRPGVINTDMLTWSERRGHDLTGTVYDVRGCAKGEANGSFLALNHNRLAGFVGTHCPGGIRCSCLCGCCWLCCGCLFRCGCAYLRKRQRSRQRTNNT